MHTSEILFDQNDPAKQVRKMPGDGSHFDYGAQKRFVESNSLAGTEIAGTSMVRKNCVRVLTLVTFIVWSLGLGVGALYSIQYETTPTRTANVQERWPVDAECLLNAVRPTLVMFVHPRCPCSRASVSELASLVRHCPGVLEVQVVFLKPPEFPADWSKTDLWDNVAQIPGVVSRLDVNGMEHRRFNASVSGEVFLYRPNGDLVWHGGITSSRGHVGDNRGRTAIEEFLRHNVSPIGSTAVFGCELESQRSSLQKCEFCRDGRISP